MEDSNERFMRRAIAISEESMHSGGGPFGAVIVKNGKIIAESGNSVTKDNDPTAHAEVNAIRKAAKKLGTFDLSGCIIYASCEPCPMCLGAIYWAHISRIYYCNTHTAAAEIGFDDAYIYDEMALPISGRHVPTERILPGEGDYVFQEWENSNSVTRY